MKQISKAGWYYVICCIFACGYFCTAAIGGWPGLGSGTGSSGHSYSSGYYFDRSSGGFGGGGK